MLVSIFAFGYGVNPASAQTIASITCSSVVFQGDVNISPSGTPTNVWFEWGTSSSLENRTNSQTFTYSSVFSQSIYNLFPNTTYYYRAVARNAPFGTVYGRTLNFATPPCGSPAPTPVVSYVAPIAPTVIKKTVETKVSTLKPSLVSLSVVSDNETVCSGEEIGFTVEYKNVSNQSLENVVVRVALPGEANFEGSSAGIFSDKDNTLTIDVGTLSPEEKGRAVVRVSANRDFSEDKTLVTTANLVYTTKNGAQEEAVAYALSGFGCYSCSQNEALALFGGSFFPSTLTGWLILLIIFVVLFILSKRVYSTYTEVETKK